jgi:hypothetical protein
MIAITGVFMQHLTVNTWTLALLLFISLSATSVADEKDSKTYFPTKVGAKWVYSLDGKEETEAVTAVEKKDETLIVTVHRVEAFGRQLDLLVKVSKDGLFQLTGGPAVKHPPMWILKLPHKTGATWDTWLGAQGGGDNTMTAYGPEKIKVPAGEFEAIRVETKFTVVDGSIVAKYWYAPGVGLVKETVGDKKTVGHKVRVLESFTPGKD